MNNVKIITDSCCSLSQEKLKQLDIDFVQMSFNVNNENFNAYEHPIKDGQKFYDELAKSKNCSTSCVNPYTFSAIFEKYVKLGYDVVYICISSGMSATYKNAVVSAKEINTAFGRHVWVADSLSGSYGIALMLEYAVKLRNEGKTAEEIFESIDKNRMNVFAVFVSSDLIFLNRSGRINRFVASIGTLLKVTPVITANDKGELKLLAKCIGRKKAIKTIQDFILQKACLENERRIYIGHTGVKEDAERLAEFIKVNTDIKDVVVDLIDYTMGCNCGSYTLAVFGKLNVEL